MRGSQPPHINVYSGLLAFSILLSISDYICNQKFEVEEHYTERATFQSECSGVHKDMLIYHMLHYGIVIIEKASMDYYICF